VDDVREVLGVGAMRSRSSLIAKPFQVAVDVDGTTYLLRRPTVGGCQPGTQSLWFGKFLPCLAAKPFSGGVATLTGPHATPFRPGPRALGPTLCGLITPCGLVPQSSWSDIVRSNHTMWAGAEFRPSLSKGV
jgi:hypothetical protein